MTNFFQPSGNIKFSGNSLESDYLKLSQKKKVIKRGLTMFAEEEYIQLSALQHYLFCPRQCALAYLELYWQENELTALGRLLHKKVHEEKYEKRPGLIIARGLRIKSSQLGLSGQTDVVEFHTSVSAGTGCKLSGFSGRWQPFPVEYKRGKPKKDQSDEVQLCAQAICLEEVLDIEIPAGAIFYGKSRRRHPVVFTKELRDLTKCTAHNIHTLFKSGITPKAKYEKKCESCSLIEQCLPKETSGKKLATNYINRMAGQFL